LLKIEVKPLPQIPREGCLKFVREEGRRMALPRGICWAESSAGNAELLELMDCVRPAELGGLG
jgi:hypothetical protein